MGPPGIGKTAATFFVINEVLDRGGWVLFAVYTAQLASRMRERFSEHPMKSRIRIDTCYRPVCGCVHVNHWLCCTGKLDDISLIFLDLID